MPRRKEKKNINLQASYNKIAKDTFHFNAITRHYFGPHIASLYTNRTRLTDILLTGRCKIS